jgi:hypothetical protein
VKYSFIFLFFLVIISCKKETVENTAASNYYSYFPLAIGSWIIYTVDSIGHLKDDDLTNETDTSLLIRHYKIKEVIESDFTDGEGHRAFHITRYKQENDTMPWTFLSVWTANLTLGSAQRVEDNIRYLKLAFPINADVTWNGNAFNDFPEEDYSYTDIHVPYSISSFDFDSTLKVLQNDDANLIHQIYKEEKYAKNVGMIYKQRDSLNVYSVNGQIRISNGFEYKESISAYGH